MTDQVRLGRPHPDRVTFAPSGELHMEILRCGCTLMKQWGIFCPEHAALVHKTIKEAVDGTR